MSRKNLNVLKKSLKFSKKITDKKILKIFQNFELSLDLKEKFLVAVSGGPDSMALAYLSKIYSQKKKLRVKYFIVDHKLRDNSTKEAEIVKKLLKKHQIKLEILTWKSKKPSSNIQSLARNARYELLFKKCKKLGIKNILLGHHLDDLLENFIIRMTRGSGLRGLASFGKKVENNKINIFRPLIRLEKKDLIYISKKIFKSYITDPSNSNDIFKRTKIRNLLMNLEKEGLNKKKFLSTIYNLKTSDDTIKFFVNDNLKKNTFYSEIKKTITLNSDFFDKPSEIIFRSLSECIRMIGEKYYYVRGKKLDYIIHSLKEKSQFKATLGRCILKKVNQTVVISREN